MCPPREAVRTSSPARLSREAAHGRAARRACRAKRRADERPNAFCRAKRRTDEQPGVPAARNGARTSARCVRCAKWCEETTRHARRAKRHEEATRHARRANRRAKRCEEVARCVRCAKRHEEVTRCARCAKRCGRAARRVRRAKRRTDEQPGTPAARSGADEQPGTPVARSGARERLDTPAARSGARTSNPACPPCEPARITLHANKPPANPDGFAGGFQSVRGKTSPDRAQSRLSTGVRSRNSREMLHRAAMPMTA